MAARPRPWAPSDSSSPASTIHAAGSMRTAPALGEIATTAALACTHRTEPATPADRPRKALRRVPRYPIVRAPPTTGGPPLATATRPHARILDDPPHTLANQPTPHLLEHRGACYLHRE